MLDEDFKNWIIGRMTIKQLAALRTRYEREVKPDLIAEAAELLSSAIAKTLGEEASIGFALVDMSMDQDEQALYDELDKNGLDNII
jgi:hypothetical protein